MSTVETGVQEPSRTRGRTSPRTKKKPDTSASQVTSTEAAGTAEPLETLETEDSGIMEGRTSGPMVPVYFEFDSSSIAGEQVQRIETNADFIKENPALKIRIEGNCDPRGTQEYNLALGERRAQAAKTYLVNLGVNAEQLTTVSFGEEKLLLFGHDEISWAQNRRDGGDWFDFLKPLLAANREDRVLTRAEWLDALTRVSGDPSLAATIEQMLDQGAADPAAEIAGLFRKTGVPHRVENGKVILS